ncbi:phospholipase A2 [Daldinia bambusicola]|nr:phospholipase A2 [Daldinia bambusicola]
MAQPASSSTAEKWSSLLLGLNPIPGFAEYTGPYKVGTVDVEIPVTELESPAPTPRTAADIDTIQFRIFYPAHPDSEGKRITWLPAPQREHLAAYIKFLGISPLLAEAISFFPRHLHYTTIPVIKNAPVLDPNTPNKRWPTAIFSHGLGGTRNAYSQLVGSLASHGVVVICPEHRDGSAVATFIRIPSQQDRYFVRSTRREVPYLRIAHVSTNGVHAQRDDQLRIRLWETGLVHEAILAIDNGVALTNLNKSTPSLSSLAGKLHVHEPGSIIFAGHSFGSASTVLFLKSVFYAGRPEIAGMREPLYAPSRESSLYKQITPRNVTILLDMWCFPFLSKATQDLFILPLPAYAADNRNPSSSASSSSAPPGGNAILAIGSEDFFKWKVHLHLTARVLSPDPNAPIVQATAFRDTLAAAAALPSSSSSSSSSPGSSSSSSSGSVIGRLGEPYFFFVRQSAHLSQSDFAILFPRLINRIFGCENPERALRLNRRAILQVLRANGIPVARTCVGDLVDGMATARGSGGRGVRRGSATTVVGDGVDDDNGDDGAGSRDSGETRVERGDHSPGAGAESGDTSSENGGGVHDDKTILDRNSHGTVDAWCWIDIVGMGQVVADNGEVTSGAEAVEEQEPQMADVIEPQAAEDDVAGRKADANNL